MTLRERGNPLNEDDIRMLSVAQVAELMGISVRGVWRNVGRKQLPEPVYVGRLARWPLAALKSWIDQGCPPQDGNGGKPL